MGATILIADDLSFMRMVQKEILTERGYTIVGEAADGKEAVEKYRTLRPDLVLLDITMPHMNGLELAAELKRTRPDFPVILVTGYSKVVNDPTLRQAGVAEVVMKPLSLKDLAAVIDRDLAVPDQEV